MLLTADYEHIVDKRLVRNAFDRAAASYDQAAALQREVCDRMLTRLDSIKRIPDVILDAGSGTGYGTRKLLMRYPTARILALDIATAMHTQARPAVLQREQSLMQNQNGSQISYVGGDAEKMPFKYSCVELVWSNLMLQWCNDLNPAFAEVYRILRSGGLFMFSTFGPDTLKELRQAFRSADEYRHVNHFTEIHDIRDKLARNGFAASVMEREYITMTYDDVISVMRDLKAIGAHNVSQGRRRGLTGKTTWQKAINCYEMLRTRGELPATFEVIYGFARKPDEKRFASVSVALETSLEF
jgi:malonyl-CoA O-methyltransferase